MSSSEIEPDNKEIKEIIDLIKKMDESNHKKVIEEIDKLIHDIYDKRIPYFQIEGSDAIVHFAAQSPFALDLFNVILDLERLDFNYTDKEGNNLYSYLLKNNHLSLKEKEHILNNFISKKKVRNLENQLRIEYNSNPDIIEFISNTKKFDKFQQEFIICSILFTQEDLDSLGGKETPLAERFSALWRQLEAEGVPSINGQKINFWSGREAKKKAEEPQETKENSENKEKMDEISSSNVLVLQLLFTCFYELQKHKIVQSNLISEALSKLYSYQATGDVNVYISSNKRGFKPGLTIGNHFWNAELFALQDLLLKGQVDSISIHLYDHENKLWLKPIDIESHEADILLFLIRREANSTHSKNSLDSLVKEIKETAEIAKVGENFKYSNFMHWIKKHDANQPKQAMPLGALRSIIKHWKKVTVNKTLEQKQEGKSEEKKAKETKDVKDAKTHKETLLFSQTTTTSTTSNGSSSRTPKKRR